MTCPFCGSAHVERVAQWGGQLITAQWRCGACNSYFEAVREDFEESAHGRAAQTAARNASSTRSPRGT